MGKTSLLRWVERKASLWQGRAIVHLDARGLNERSPMVFVRGLAACMGKSVSDCPYDALHSLLPMVLLIDNADLLLTTGSEFDGEFFGALRSFGQMGRFAWVAASPINLRDLMGDQGLTSPFLNDSRVVYTSLLEESAAQELALRGGEAIAASALGLAGSWAYGVQWVGDALWRGAETADSVGDAFANAMEPIFERWWARQSLGERDILMAAVDGLEVSGATRPTRLQVTRLVKMGLLTRQNDVCTLPGRAWRNFVEVVP